MSNGTNGTRSTSVDMTNGGSNKKGRRLSLPQAVMAENAVSVKRVPFTQPAFDELHLKNEDDEDRKSVADKLKSKIYCSKQRIFKLICAYLPIIRVIRYYNLKEYMVTDILAGVTIGILHIPQALAFGMLTSVKVENGLYTSVWPVLIYVVFGTSAHVSMGTSAVICIVTAAVIDREADGFKLLNPHLMNNTGNGTLTWEDIPEFMDFKESTAMGITFFTGAILIAMGVLKLGFITAYMSESFFSAFTSGAGVHIATSQIPAILGLKTPRYGGAFKIIKTYGAIFAVIEQVNVCALLTAIISGIIILFVKDYINEKFKHKLPIPIPVELFIVIFATLISYFANFAENFGVDVVSTIPNDIPAPVIPSFVGVESYLVDCFVLAILIFANTIAMAKICAKRHNYEIDDSQELIAYGMCNFGGSFLKCFPSAVAPPRSMVASTMNTKTTICGVFSTALLIMIILVMSALFEPLPKSALAAIIVVALKGLFIQMKDCVRFWKVNRIDFVIWFCTIISVVFLDIDYGLGIGVIVSLITVVFQAQFARGYRMGKTMKDSAIVEHRKYIDSMETSGIKVYRFHSNLFFANAEIFRMKLYRNTVNPRKILKFIKKQERKNASEEKKNKSEESYTKRDSNPVIEITGLKINGTKEKEIIENGKNGYANGNGVANGNGIAIVSADARKHSQSTNGSQRSSLVAVDNPVFKEEGNNFNNGLDPSTEYSIYRRNMSVTTITTYGSADESIDPEDGQEVVTDEIIRHMRKIHHVIIDFSTVNYMDVSGANVISHIYKEYGHVNVRVFLSNVSHDVRQTMLHAGVFDTIPENYLFIDVQDAIAVARLEQVLPPPEGGWLDFTIEEATEDQYITAVQ